MCVTAYTVQCVKEKQKEWECLQERINVMGSADRMVMYVRKNLYACEIQYVWECNIVHEWKGAREGMQVISLGLARQANVSIS